MFCVTGGIICRAGVARMFRIGRETVIDRGKAADMVDQRVFKEESEGGVQLGGVDFRIAPGTSVNKPRILVSKAKFALKSRASHSTQ